LFISSPFHGFSKIRRMHINVTEMPIHIDFRVKDSPFWDEKKRKKRAIAKK
jgi:hypothetical protein